MKTFQDEEFQKAMAEALGRAPPLAEAAAEPAVLAESAEPAEAAPGPVHGPQPPPATAASSAEAPGTEEFLQQFLQSFDRAVDQDGGFEKSLTSLMTSMLSSELICEPLQQITTKLEPWLKSQKGLAQADQTRYENQLRIYKQILSVYSSSPDPLPEDARTQVQGLLTELHTHGQLPEEVLQQVTPKEAEGEQENFDAFVKSMGLDANLGSAEQDLLKKLTEDPEELTKVMKEMAENIPEEACKQQ